MPEVPEVAILTQYLLFNLKGKTVNKIEILSGKYLKNGIENIKLFDGTYQYKIKNVESKGKLIWMTLKNTENKNIVYITSHLGLTGFWNFVETRNDRLVMRIEYNKNNKVKLMNLFFTDDRNFGNFDIYTDADIFNKKIDELAIDSLTGDYSIHDFEMLYKTFLDKSKQRKNQYISLALLKQKSADGIVSGIGNYLMAEILYEAGISPFRTVGSLSDDEIKTLGKAIQYITKLSYIDNKTEYMSKSEDFLEYYENNISKTFDKYHENIKIKKKDTFTFKVYQQKKDPDDNPVEIDKSIQKTRSTYWCPNKQQ